MKLQVALGLQLGFVIQIPIVLLEHFFVAHTHVLQQVPAGLVEASKHAGNILVLVLFWFVSILDYFFLHPGRQVLSGCYFNHVTSLMFLRYFFSVT